MYKRVSVTYEGCKVCDRLKDKRGQWNRHFKTVHLKIKNYQCPFRNRKFGESATVKKHMRVCKEKQENVKWEEEEEGGGA